VPIVGLVGISMVQEFAAFVIVGPDSPVPFLLLLPYGVAWTFIGLRMTVRGAQTIVDQPTTSIEPEGSAA
jgi:hypothetical protein